MRLSFHIRERATEGGVACARSISIKWEKGKAREEEEKRASKHRTHHALQTSSYRVDAPTALNRREGLAECTRQKRIEHRCTGGRRGIPFRGTLALEEIDSIHTRVPDAASYRGNLKFISKGWTWCAPRGHVRPVAFCRPKHSYTKMGAK